MKTASDKSNTKESNLYFNRKKYGTVPQCDYAKNIIFEKN